MIEDEHFLKESSKNKFKVQNEPKKNLKQIS